MEKAEFKAYLDNLVATGEMTQEIANYCMETKFPTPKKPQPTGPSWKFRTHNEIKRPWDETQSERFASESGRTVK